VAASCYSGTLTREASVAIKDADYIQRMVQKKARRVMTSGGLEPVADSGGSGHSVFASAFIAPLQQNNGVMDAQSFFTMTREPVVLAAPQTPEYSNRRFAGHEGGHFVFVRKPWSAGPSQACVGAGNLVLKVKAAGLGPFRPRISSRACASATVGK
jgi:hypothetical protein